MQIPHMLRKKITGGFGPRGEKWLDKLPLLVEDCIRRWNLTDCVESSVISYNYVCFANSPEYGAVALKVGIPHLDLTAEMTAIKLYDGKNICQCYEQDPDLGAMLLERIQPGYDLTSVKSSSQRIKLAADVVAALPMEVSSAHDLPSWSDLAARTFGRLKEQSQAQKMLGLAAQAEELLRELEDSGRKRVLLHGDLNHYNILKSAEGWMAIDPKGQIGVTCMEAGRFMLNELEIAAPRDPVGLMNEMTAAFSEKLKEPRSIIALVAFLDKALSTSWKFEGFGPRDLTEDVEECGLLLRYYRSIT